MRERLKMMIAEANVEWLSKTYDHETDKTLAEYTTDHILANGVIVPPCKVGQTVYCIRYDKARKPFVKPLAVLSVTVWGKGKFTVFTTKEDCFGMTAFLTREEAEQALKEAQG